MNLEELLKMKKKYEQDFIFNEDYDDTHYLDAFIEKYGEALYEAMKELEKYLTRDAKMNDITLTQLDDMKHALGIDLSKMRKGRWKHKCYRNRFVASKSEDWEDLVNKGYANKSIGLGMNYYYVTQKGLDKIATIFDLRKLEV